MTTVKVAHVITRLIVGGAQENTLFTVELLSRNSHFQVTLISGIETGAEGDLLNGLNLNNLPYRLIRVKALVREINPFKDIVACYTLFRLFRRERFDIVHTHSSKAGIIGRLAAYLAGVKVIIHTIHGLPFHPYQNCFLNRLYIWLEKIAAYPTSKIITVCDVMKEKACQARVAPCDKFFTIYSGFDLDQFLTAPARYDKQAVRKIYGIDSNDVVIAKVARLFYLKGHHYLIEAAPELIKRIPRLKFLFIGDGILKQKLEEEISRHNMEDRFIFTGLIPPYDVPRLLCMADLVVHCSLREGLARVIPCSLAMKIPVISFDIDGAKEVVKDYHNGFIVPPHDKDTLSRRIVELLTNPSLYRTCQDNGPSGIDPVFRKEYMVDEIEKLYYSLTHKRA